MAVQQIIGKRIVKYDTSNPNYKEKPKPKQEVSGNVVEDDDVYGEKKHYYTPEPNGNLQMEQMMGKLINNLDNTVQLIDRTTEPFTEFQRFITNDFPTGNKAYVKLIDDTVQTNLKGRHRVKMNKGYLLKSFDFHYGGEVSGSDANTVRYLTENNSMYVYKSGSLFDNFYNTGSVDPSPSFVDQNNALRFRFGVIELFFCGIIILFCGSCI